MEKQDYIETIRKAGFNDVKIIEQHFFTEPDMDERLVGKITSVQVRALKGKKMGHDKKTACCGEDIEESPKKEP